MPGDPESALRNRTTGTVVLGANIAWVTLRKLVLSRRALLGDDMGAALDPMFAFSLALTSLPTFTSMPRKLPILVLDFEVKRKQ